MMISRRSQQKFADLASRHGTLSKIEEVFEAEGFSIPKGFVRNENVTRRVLVDAFETSIDLRDPNHQRRLLRVYVSSIEDWGEDQSTGGLVQEAHILVRCLKRDDVPIDDQGNLLDPQPQPFDLSIGNYRLLGDPGVLSQHLARINRSVGDDAADVIGASKELVESVCKLVLDDFGVSYRGDNLPTLYKKTAQALGIDRNSVPDSAKGSEAAKKILQNLATLVQSMAELRNEIGSGHGRSKSSPAEDRHARLVLNAARTVAEFVLDTWHDRRKPEPE